VQTKYPGVKVLKAGVLEGEELSEEAPKAELFATRRVEWVNQLHGAKQYEGTM
jgi:hypothetical protein